MITCCGMINTGNFQFFFFSDLVLIFYFGKKMFNVHTQNNSSSPMAHMFVPGGYFITENVQFCVFKAHWDHQHRSTAEASHQNRINFAFSFSEHVVFFSLVHKSIAWMKWGVERKKKEKKFKSFDFNLFRITNQFDSQISCFEQHTIF